MSTVDYESDNLDQVRSVVLDWYEEEGEMHVNPRNQKRFKIQTDRAIEILQVKVEEEREFEKQFDLLLELLAEWIRERADVIGTPFLTRQDDSMLFLVLKNAPKFDEEFEDSLSELDFQIANDPDLSIIKLHTMSLPPVSGDALQSFIDESFSFSYHGHKD